MDEDRAALDRGDDASRSRYRSSTTAGAATGAHEMAGLRQGAGGRQAFGQPGEGSHEDEVAGYLHEQGGLHAQLGVLGQYPWVLWSAEHGWHSGTDHCIFTGQSDGAIHFLLQ